MAADAEMLAGRVPIVGGASAPTSEEVLLVARQAAEHGTEYLMIMAPSRLGTDLDAHHHFFDEISSGLAGQQIILQNAPAPIGAGLGPNEMIDLIRAHECISYAKEDTLPSGPSISSIRQAGVPHLRGVFGGGGARYIIDELTRGAVGALPAVELTDIHVALFNAFACGEEAEARDLYAKTLPLLVAQMVYRMRLTKYVLHKRGIASQLHVRAPLPELDDLAKGDIDRMLATLLSAE